MNIIYCDIDGVFNPHSNRFGDLNHRDSWGDYQPSGSFEVYSPKMVSAFNELVSDHEAVCVWNTTWEQDAIDFGRNIGLEHVEEWEIIPAFEHGSGKEWLKFESFKAHYTQNLPDKAVWIDNDLADNPEAIAWCQERGVLVVSPDPIYGLSPESVGDISLYLFPDLLY